MSVSPREITISARSATGIADDLEAAIRQGVLRTGDHLPTIRELADRLTVSPTTVTSAYRTLRTRGLTSSGGRQGTTVRYRPDSPVRLFTPQPEGVRNLADGNPDPALLPRLGPLLSAFDPEPVLYGPEPNHLELVAAARSWFAADGIPGSDVAVVGGARDGIERVLAVHLRPGDRVAIEDPGFPGNLDLLDHLGVVPQPLPIDDRGPLPDGLERALAAGARAVVVVPSAQSPTGACLDEGRSAELGAILDRYPEVLVVEDDHHAALVTVAPVATLWSPSRRRWAVIRSVSKFLGPDLRLAVLSGDPDTVGIVESHQLIGAGWVSTLLQRVVADLLEDPATKQLIETAKTTYAERRQTLLRALAARGVTATGRSGTSVWVPVPSEVAVVQGLLEAGWAVAPGEHFRIEAPPGIRITTATLTAEEADRFATDLAAVLAGKWRRPFA